MKFLHRMLCAYESRKDPGTIISTEIYSDLPTLTATKTSSNSVCHWEERHWVSMQTFKLHFLNKCLCKSLFQFRTEENQF